MGKHNNDDIYKKLEDIDNFGEELEKSLGDLVTNEESREHLKSRLFDLRVSSRAIKRIIYYEKN